MARRYLIVMAAAAIATVAATAAFIWLVDPLGIYDSPRVDGFNAVKPALKTRARVFKTVTAARGDWQALIVGTSRAETGFDPRHRYFAGLRTFNAALGGESYSESLALVRAASRGGALRRVVAVLDFEVGNAHYEGAIDYVEDNYRPWRRAALAVNLELAGQALRTIIRQDADAAFLDQALWHPDGRFAFTSPKHGNRAAALSSEAEYLDKALFRGPARRYALATAMSQPLERVRELVALAHSKEIDLVLIIAPVHARQLEMLAAAGLWSEWEEWKRQLVDIDEVEASKARRPPFALWDFSYNEATTELFPAFGDRASMRWYYESSHFTPALGDRVLDRIAGASDPEFGVALTPGNIESHLQAIRTARAAWRQAHPADAAEIEALARNARLVGSLHRAQPANP